MRRKDGSGEKEFNGAIDSICERMAAREEGWKRVRSLRSVIKRVLVGGEGVEMAGRLDRSSESEGLERVERIEGDEGDDCGDSEPDIVIVVVVVVV